MDETIIILRVAIVDVKPIEIRSPFEIEFDVGFTQVFRPIHLRGS